MVNSLERSQLRYLIGKKDEGTEKSTHVWPGILACVYLPVVIGILNGAWASFFFPLECALRPRSAPYTFSDTEANKKPSDTSGSRTAPQYDLPYCAMHSRLRSAGLQLVGPPHCPRNGVVSMGRCNT